MRRTLQIFRATLQLGRQITTVNNHRCPGSTIRPRTNKLTQAIPSVLARNSSNQVENSTATHLYTSTMALTRSTDPLVWIDCEMTGLDTTKDRILSISCFITAADLTLLDDTGYHAVISTPKSVLDAMGEWCQRTHTATGLVAACQSSDAVPAQRAASELLEYIKRYVFKPKTALLAGNSVHADKMFLVNQPWTEVVEYLHYRILDVSAIKEGVRRWCGDEVLRQVPIKKGVHSAEEDIRESLEEARYYMRMFKGSGG